MNINRMNKSVADTDAQGKPNERTTAAADAMTDLEMTKLCADAMGIEVTLFHSCVGPVLWSGGTKYEPLRDDMQAMALVKRFGLDVFAPDATDPKWAASCQGASLKHFPGAPYGREVSNDDLNRAIVKCVARMQRAAGGSQVKSDATPDAQMNESPLSEDDENSMRLL